MCGMRGHGSLRRDVQIRLPVKSTAFVLNGDGNGFLRALKKEMGIFFFILRDL
jgi:hypothetical protein